MSLGLKFRKFVNLTYLLVLLYMLYLTYLNLRNGGVICENCLEKDRREQGINPAELLLISDNCIKLLRFIMDNKLDAARKLKLDKKVIKELSVLTLSFLNFHS